MLLIDWRQFLPGNPARNPKLLGGGIGTDARNLDMSQGDFRGMRDAQLVHTLTGLGGQVSTIYRFGRDVASDTAYWLATAADADYARSMLASDPTERTYRTGGGTAPVYTDSTILGSPPYPTGTVGLGVPAPSGAMTLTLGTAGTGPDETRVYTDTFLRANLDESHPNFTSASITVPGGSTVNISGLPAAPSGTHGISLRRIYVSTGTTEFQRCVSQSSATTTAADTGTRGDVLQTGGATTKPAWLTPSDNLAGIIQLWAGLHGAHEDKGYSVCVPNNPHAWPQEYRRIVPDKIVGTATFGENWVLATTGVPRVVNGNAPLGMIARPVTGFKQACVSKRSVRGVGHGVCWASNDGLAYHGQLGTKVLTDGILTKAQWRALDPDSLIGANWGRWYIGFYNDGTRRSFMIDTVEPKGIIWTDVPGYGVFEDSVSETLYVLGVGNIISKWDYGLALEASAKSPIYRVPTEVNAGVVRIVASTYPVRFTLWANGDLVTHQMDVFDDEPIRLPGGYEASEFQAEIKGKGPVEGVFVGQEPADLP